MIRLMRLFFKRAIAAWGITLLTAGLSLTWNSTVFAAEKLAGSAHKSGPEIFVQTGHHSVVSALTISPDGRFLAAADDNLDTRNIKIWEMSSGREYRTLFVKTPEQIRWIRFSADVKQIFIVAVTKIDVIDIGSGAHLKTIDIGHIRNIRVVFSIDVDRLLSDLGLHAAHQNYLGMLQPKARTLVARDFVYSLTRKEQGKYNFVFDIKKTSDHRRVQQVELDNLSHFVLVGEVVVVTPDFKYLIAADKTNFKSTIKIWDLQTGRITKELGKVKPARFSWLAFSLNRRFLFNFDGLMVTPENQHGAAISELELNKKMGNSKVWDIESGRLLYSFSKGETPSDEYQSFFKENFFDKKNQKIYVRWGVQGSLDNKYAAVADWHDAIIRLIEQKTNKEIAQFITFTDGEWIVITPDGYFDASANGARHLNVRVGDNVYGIDQFYSKFYRPELVQLALAGKEVPKGELITNIASQKPAPRIQIISPVTGSFVDKDNVSLSLKITDNGGGLGAVNVYLNGAQVANEARAVIVKGKTSVNEKILTFIIPLI
ncbi:MAG: Ig-like domain-containing protein [Smithella sp.]